MLQSYHRDVIDNLLPKIRSNRSPLAMLMMDTAFRRSDKGRYKRSTSFHLRFQSDPVAPRAGPWCWSCCRFLALFASFTDLQSATGWARTIPGKTVQVRRVSD